MQNDGFERRLLMAGADARIELSVADSDRTRAHFVAGPFSGRLDTKLQPNALDDFRLELAVIRDGDDRTATIYSPDARLEINVERRDDEHAYVEVEARPPEGPEVQLIYRFLTRFDDIDVR